jgi:transposase
MDYIELKKAQNWLLPLSIKDRITKKKICFLVQDFVESLDFSNFDILYDVPDIQLTIPK